MIYRLPDHDYWFPDPLSIPDDQREDDGLFAIGGDLDPRRLLEAYSQGIFPWCDFHAPELLWYCPMQRFVIFPDEIHISHSMRTLINKGTLRATIDAAFTRVIGRCSEQRIHQPGAWLGPKMVEAYTRLHELGYAHSVEVWKGDDLVGGLYGVALGPGFFGESMFSDAPSASKFALIALAQNMPAWGGTFIDCQFETPHLRTMGGRHIPYTQYLQLLYPSHTDSTDCTDN